MTEPKISMVALGIRLAIFAGIASCILAFADYYTTPARKAMQQSVNDNAVQMVLPDFDHLGAPIYMSAENEISLTSHEGDKHVFTPAFKGGNLIGFACSGKSRLGYGGELSVIFGITLDGTVGIVTVTQHKETPGLGTVETDRKKQKTIFNLFDPDTEKVAPNPYLDQFKGKRLASDDPAFEWKVTKDEGTILFKSGATWSMRAITDAVYQTARDFIQQKDLIIQKAEAK